MKKSTKVLCMALSLILAVGVGVGGTLAWLTATTDTVTNTFTEAKLITKPTDFVLREHKAVPDDTDHVGYKLTGDEVTENDYVVVPGVDLDKDPFVRVKPNENAYLFITVDNNLQTGMTFAIDPIWAELKDDEGQAVKTLAGNPVYVLKAGVLSKNIEKAFNILQNKKVTVAGDFKYQDKVACNIVFNAYLSQSDNLTPLQAWNNSFAATADAPKD